MKYSFFNDYSEGAHPAILDLLVKTNLQQEAGYGEDGLSAQAKTLIRQELASPEADIHFISGGTLSNLTVLSSLMRPYESVIAANFGHIYVHEAGAIEATGHKINMVPTSDGKLTVETIQAVVDEHQDEHMVKPRVVFISQATEVGTVYTKAELEGISAVCRRNGLYLYLDGARLGSGLCSPEADMSMADLCALTDVFYIGGNKNGALIGEAIVINNPALRPYFRHCLKQRGALLAKGRLVGIQFIALFTDGLYYELARHANAMAARLIAGLTELGIPFFTRSTTNQIFPILPNSLIASLQGLYGFYPWAKVDEDHFAVRLVTSWATRPEMVEEFLADARALLEKN